MSKSHVLSGLIRKRSELSGLALYHDRQRKQALDQLAAIDKSLKVFDPTIDLQAIKSKRVSHRNRFFLNGEGSRLVLEVLRDNPGGLDTGAIVDEIVRRKEIDLAEVDAQALLYTVSSFVCVTVQIHIAELVHLTKLHTTEARKEGFRLVIVLAIRPHVFN